MRDELLEVLDEKYKNEHSRIRIIGHSLGGALATIMALDIIYNVSWVAEMRENVSVRTFGSPCVGNAHFVGLFNEQVIDSNRYFITLDPGKRSLVSYTRILDGLNKSFLGAHSKFHLPNSIYSIHQ